MHYSSKQCILRALLHCTVYCDVYIVMYSNTVSLSVDLSGLLMIATQVSSLQLQVANNERQCSYPSNSFSYNNLPYNKNSSITLSTTRPPNNCSYNFLSYNKKLSNNLSNNSKTLQKLFLQQKYQQLFLKQKHSNYFSSNINHPKNHRPTTIHPTTTLSTDSKNRRANSPHRC